MSLAYVPPGVTVQELTSPSLTPLLAIPGSICLVGVASGAITRTDIVTLSSNTATNLPGLPRDNSNNLLATLTGTGDGVSLVIDAINPSLAPTGYSASTDYTISNSNGTIARQVTAQTLASGAASAQANFTLSSGAVPAVGQIVRLTNTGPSPVTETVTVLSVSGQVVTATTNLVNSYSSGGAATWGNIPDGNTVYVTYAYTPNDYFNPIRLNSMADIQNRFGPAWDSTNSVINSQLSFAASLAFQNGASNVVLQPLYNINNSGVRVQPNASQAASPAVWATVFNNLIDLQDINILVPVIGQSAANVSDAIMLQIEQAAQDFIYMMKNSQQQYVIGLFGEDSSTSTSGSPLAQDATLLIHAQTIESRYASAVTEQLVFVNTSQFSVANVTGTVLVGGQYMAAAVAGMLAARSPATTITRQPVSGFVAVTDTRSKLAKNNDAANGLLVVESKGGLVQVRHGVTMDNTSVIHRELNVVRAKHFIIESVVQTLDTQVIGKLVADTNAPTAVNNLVIGTLEDLRGLGALSDYANVASRITQLDPTAMEVRFDYLPAFVINYINVVFSLDLTTQSITVSSSGSTG